MLLFCDVIIILEYPPPIQFSAEILLSFSLYKNSVVFQSIDSVIPFMLIKKH